MNQTIKNIKHQAGMTLMELIAGLAILAAVVVGALSLFANANSSQNATQMLKDLTAIRSAVQSLYMGQGGYGNVSLNQMLITANKVPATMTISGTTINTALGGTLTITGNTTNFIMVLTNLQADVCTSLLTNASTGWSSVKVNTSGALTTFPVSPATATDAAQCGGSAPFTITWTTLH